MAALSFLPLPAFAQDQAIKWLVVPVKDLSGEGPAGIETAVTTALTEKLSATNGWKARVHDPEAKVVQLALEQGLLTEREASAVPDLAAAQHVGLVWGADVVVLGMLTRQAINQETAVQLVVNIVGVVGRQSAGPGKKLDLPAVQTKVNTASTADGIAQSLTSDIGVKLSALIKENPGLWESRPEYAAAWEAEGQEHVKAGRYREACLAFEAAVRANPNSGADHRMLAQALLMLGQPDQARHQLEEVLRADPKDPEAMLALGEVYLAIGNGGRAIGQFESAALILKDDPRPMSGLARAHLALGDVSYALKAYEKLLANHPKDPALHRGYGDALLQANQFEKALVEFRSALALDPGNQQARESLANLLLVRGKLSEGIEELRLVTDQSQSPIFYSMQEYRKLMRYLADETNRINDEFDQRFTQYMNGTLSQPQFLEVVHRFHQRSDNLARLLERMNAPEELDRSHRYWVLAANLLNQSDFEVTRFANNEGQDHLRRAQLFRDASREAARQARVLAATELNPRPATSRTIR